MVLLSEVSMRKIFVIFLVFVMVITCTGCYDGYSVARKYPYYKADYWYCEEIDFAFCYEHLEDGRIIPGQNYLTKDGKTMTVFVIFVIDNWYIALDNGDVNVSIEDQLMSGTWRYRKGDLVFTVKEDNLFDGAYWELVFVAGK